MTSLLDFFNTITGLNLNINNPVVLVLVCVFGFLILYNIVHVIFGSFTNLFK